MNRQQQALINEYENIPQDDLERRLQFLNKNEDILKFIGGDLYIAWRYEAEETLGLEKMIELEERIIKV